MEVDLLMPVPGDAAVQDGWYEPGSMIGLDIRQMHPGVDHALGWLSQELAHWQIGLKTLENDKGLEARLDPGMDQGPESYALNIGENGIRLTAGAAAGLFYGLCTLRQWVRIHRYAGVRGKLRCLTVRDGPAFKHRGVMLDISRDKVPNLETLRLLIDRLASWKINQCQLYMEHTFAYIGHESVWSRSGALTANEVQELAKYCHERFITLVPNQNSFGHFHRWLIHEPYRGLAECPAGVDHAFSTQREPFSLCPGDSRVIPLLDDLFGQLLPNFRTELFNVGLDETFDLGMGRSKEVCQQRGKERVYLDFLKEVHALARRHGKRIQFWGDIIVKRPDLVDDLPKDAIALEWGYEADHPFGEHGKIFAESGLEYYVCPGTGSWFSLSGRTRNTLLNLASAAREGFRHGASGYLITDWGDHGHWQPPPVSYLGFLAGAGFAWRPDLAHDPLVHDWAGHLSRFAFDDPTGVMGGVAADLGNVYLESGAEVINGTALFFLLRYPHEPMTHPRLTGLTLDGLAKTDSRIKEIESRLARSGGERTDSGAIVEEYRWVAAMLRWACRFGTARLAFEKDQPVSVLSVEIRKKLADQLTGLIEMQDQQWRWRHRLGGLVDSQAKLRHIQDVLLADPT